MKISYEDFEKVKLRTGRITDVQDFPEARKPAYKLTIDFGGEIGTKKSSAQITENYSKEELMSKTIVAVTKLSPQTDWPLYFRGVSVRRRR